MADKPRKGKNSKSPAASQSKPDFSSLPAGIDKKKLAELMELSKKMAPTSQKMAEMQAKNKAEPTPDYRKLARDEDAAEYQKKLAAPPRIIHTTNGGSAGEDGRPPENSGMGGGGGFQLGPKLQLVQNYDVRDYRVFGEAYILRGGSRIRLWDYYFDRGKGPVTPLQDGDVIETKAGSYVWSIRSSPDPQRGENIDDQDLIAIDIFPNSKARFSVRKSSSHPDTGEPEDKYVTNNVQAVSSVELMEGLFYAEIRGTSDVNQKLSASSGPKFLIGAPLDPVANSVEGSVQKLLKAGLKMPPGMAEKYKDLLGQAQAKGSKNRSAGKTFRGFIECRSGAVTFYGSLNKIIHAGSGQTSQICPISRQAREGRIGPSHPMLPGFGSGQTLLPTLSVASKIVLTSSGLEEIDLNDRPDRHAEEIARRHDVSLPGYVAALQAKAELKNFKQITPAAQKAQQDTAVKEAEEMLESAKAMDEPELIKTAKIMLEQAKRGGFSEVNNAEVQMSAKQKQRLEELARQEGKWASELRSSL